MSTLITNTFTGKTSAGSIVVTGEGGSTTTNLQQGLSKEWSLFDQAGNVLGANTVGDSFNVGSVTDVSTGHIDINFTNNMNGTSYSCVANSHYSGLLANDQYSRYNGPSNLATSSYRQASQYSNSNSEDAYWTTGSNGDLA